MAQKIPFEDFLMEVDSSNLNFVQEMHQYLTENGCAPRIQVAKSGYVVSYDFAPTKKVLLNYVFRKKGMFIRIYGENVGQYIDFLNTLPEDMVKAIDKASVCKRLVDPTKCSSRCSMGYEFALNGEDYKKCRHNGFMFLLGEEAFPYLRTFVEKELEARSA